MPEVAAAATAPVVLHEATAPAPTVAEGADVATGLLATPKTLPSRYFYDDRGSALFEQICELPEYYPTRTERAILEASAGEIAARTGPADLVELGSGNSAKTRLLIEAYRAAGASLRYAPIDVSRGVLETSAAALARAVDGIEVRPILATYEAGLAALDQVLGRAGRPRLALFLGSTIGNLAPAATEHFLAEVRARLRPGDFFLVGLDLRKETAIVEAAYNDAAGVTAAFNRNILDHLNRRFDGDFRPGRFRHRAFYEAREHQIEMHLVSEAAQEVRLRALDLRVAFAAGESVRTEISRKFDTAEFARDLARHGFRQAGAWTDARGWFCLMMARTVAKA